MTRPQTFDILGLGCTAVDELLYVSHYPPADGKVQVMIDDRDLRGGEKKWQHVKRGVPLRAEVGPKDIAKDSVFLARRDRGEKTSVPRSEFVAAARRRVMKL